MDVSRQLVSLNRHGGFKRGSQQECDVIIGGVVGTTDSKNKLDKFWSYQDLLYNYKAELTGTGNRSFIDNLD